MAKYHYRALKDGKDIINGELEAKTPREARELIRNLGFTPLEIFQADLVVHEMSDDAGNFGGINYLSLDDKILFISDLQVMLSSSISLLEALQTIEINSPRPKIKKIAHALQGEIMKGKTFSESMNYLYHDLFGEIFIDLCVTGENTGELATTLERMLMILRKQDEIKSQILQASIYPSILVTMMLGILIFFAKVLFPAFMGVINDNLGKIPPFAQSVSDLLQFVGDYWLLCIIGVFGIIGAFIYLASNPHTKKLFDMTFIRIPLLKDFVSYINLSNYMSIMAISYECGAPFPKSLSLAEKTVSNYEIKKKAKLTTKLMEKGIAYSEALHQSMLLPPTLITMIASGEKAGNLSKMLKDCSDVIDKKVELVLQALTKAFEPILLIILGGLTLALAIAFFQMYAGAVLSI